MTAALLAAPPARACEAPAAAPSLTRLCWSLLLLVPAATALAHAVVAPRSSTGPSPVVAPALARAVPLLSAVAVVGAAAAVVLLAIPLRREPRAGTTAGLALGGLGGAVCLSAVMGGGTPKLGVVALPALAVAVAVAPPPPLELVQRLLLAALRAIVWGSLVVGVLLPAWGREAGYEGPLRLGSRLVGLTPHANALGPLAVALLCLELARRPRSAAAAAAALGAVAWTQSKTSWAALAAIVAVAGLRRLAGRRGLGSAPVVAVAGLVALTGLVGVGLAGDGRSTAKGDDTTATFTGRTAIWEVTLEVWQDRPLLGVGPDLWGAAMDRRYARRVGFPPGHAHNQLVHTLGEAGLVGLGALLLALTALAELARRADPRTGGAAGALVVVLVVGAFSEAPIRSVPVAPALLLLVGALALATAGAAPEPHPGGDRG